MRYQPRPLPTEVVIEVTSKCNFSCQGCFNLKSFASEGRTQALSDEFIFKIIDSTANAKIPMVRFTGGEPLLRMD